MAAPIRTATSGRTGKAGAVVALLLGLAVIVQAQVAAPQPARTPTSAPPAPIAPLSADLTPLLAQVQQLAQATNLDIAKLRIEKWKADSANKQQAQQNADSISRNLTSALPGMIDQVRANPQSLAASFKLYRNLNALYDVFSGLAESAGAFGSKSEYEALARDVGHLDTLRRTMGDKVAELAAFRDSEVTRLRTQMAQAAAPAPAPKKIVVDDEEKPKKPAARKKKPAAKAPAAKPNAAKPAPDAATSKPQ